MSLTKLPVPQIFIDALKPDDEISTTQFVLSEHNVNYLTGLLYRLHQRSGGSKPKNLLRNSLIDLITKWSKEGRFDAAESGGMTSLITMSQINRMIIRTAPKELKWLVHSVEQLKYELMAPEEKTKYLEDKVKNMDQDPSLNVFRQTNELGKRWDRMMPDDYHELDNFKPEIPVNPHELLFQQNQGVMLAPERRYGWGNMGNWRHRFDADEGRNGSSYKEREAIHYKKDMSPFLRDK